MTSEFGHLGPGMGMIALSEPGEPRWPSGPFCLLTDQKPNRRYHRQTDEHSQRQSNGRWLDLHESHASQYTACMIRHRLVVTRMIGAMARRGRKHRRAMLGHDRQRQHQNQRKPHSDLQRIKNPLSHGARLAAALIPASRVCVTQGRSP